VFTTNIIMYTSLSDHAVADLMKSYRILLILVVALPIISVLVTLVIMILVFVFISYCKKCKFICYSLSIQCCLLIQLLVNK